ncbi:MAG: hypothetical protein K2M01_00080 [Paramuribaculum sp.]|nr:hypothetical protein [Paramuribaculum sp.]
MIKTSSKSIRSTRLKRLAALVGVCFFIIITPFNIFSANALSLSRELPDSLGILPDSIPLSNPAPAGAEVVESSISTVGDSLKIQPVDSVEIVPSADLAHQSANKNLPEPVDANRRVFTPDPTRAVWLSALFPGLGQIYNRRYWKLPIVVGAFMGLGYGTSWNNMMLSDYTRAYNDITDSDPSTKSYMDFFPPTVEESSLDKEWLTNTFKARKDYCRRNRDLCIICMVGVYLVAMVDAYVDASLSQFDISPDLTLKWAPAVIPDNPNRLPGLGVHWALVF